VTKKTASGQPKRSNYIEEGVLEVIGAREHNLKNISVIIPRNKLVVITGLSGSGKSSLAFDTIYAEGQRRYMESFSTYARQFIGSMERPDVDKIEGLSPVISIEQKTVSKNPRSTVGTITEIYDFLRLLYARCSDAYSYVSGKKMERLTEEQIIETINTDYAGHKIMLLAPVVKGRKGHYRELFEQIRKQGYSKVRVDGEVLDITPKMQVDRYKIHDIEIVIDRIDIEEKMRLRLTESSRKALKAGAGAFSVMDTKTQEIRFFSKNLMDSEHGVAYDEPQPNSFSFNTPYGSCPTCGGLGEMAAIDEKQVIPDSKISINRGGIAPLGEVRENWTFQQLRAIAKKYKFSLADPISKIPKNAMDIILHGSDGETFEVSYEFTSGFKQQYNSVFEGVLPLLKKQLSEATSDSLAQWAEEFASIEPCNECHGARLKKESLYFKIDEKNIAEIAQLEISALQTWINSLDKKFDSKRRTIALEILKEIKARIQFLIDVGLHYITLNAPAKTLSGGEAQRIRLATQIGSQLVGVMYILDEPSIGLHQRDNIRLIDSLKALRDLGNSILVVEHDKDMMEHADHIIDMGPGAGVHGGHIIANLPAADFLKSDTLTAQFINGKKQIIIPSHRREGNGNILALMGCTGNNLKNVNVNFPLGKLICVTGVSGSGKSSLVNETLYPILNEYFYNARKKPLKYKKIEGLKHLDKVIEIDQSPIGRTPRSNPVTYVGVFTDMRNLFAELPESKIRGYKPGRFSFNVKGGRCETCEGGGLRKIEMNFLPDVYVKCETCNGKRYNRETLEVKYRGKSISDVLDMSIEEAVIFFENMPHILRKIQTLHDVGLDYITLGQQSTTLSGGEAQRVKLATELSKKDTGQTFYILDEPTTGLHFEDIRVLLNVLQKLVDKGNTVLVIEHNLDVVKVADWVIDLGPEGGKGGGTILCEGTPEEVAMNKKSFTATFLRKELGL